MSDWKEVVLKDVVSILGDGLHGTPQYDENGEYYFINGSNLSNGKIVINDRTKKTSANEYRKYKKDLNDRTILVSINGTLGNVALYNNEKCVLGKSACYFNVKESVNKLFIKYVVTNRHFQEYINLYAHGTTIKNVSLKTMREYPFALPPHEEQKAITAVLASLDDKIDLLHRQNKTLEALAQTLFRHWFIDGAEDDWAEYHVKDFVEHLKNTVKPKTRPEELFHHYSMPSFDDGKKPLQEMGAEIRSNKYEVVPFSIMVSKLNPRIPRVWDIYYEPAPNSICSTEFQVFKPIKKSYFGFVYYLLNSSDVAAELEMMASGTSGSHQRVKPKDILNIPFWLPNKEKMVEFSSLVEPGLAKKVSNQKQIDTLSRLRDTLLPKLMSGEVRVKM